MTLSYTCQLSLMLPPLQLDRGGLAWWVFLFELESHSTAQAGFELLYSRDPSALASLYSALATGAYLQTQGRYFWSPRGPCCSPRLGTAHFHKTPTALFLI